MNTATIKAKLLALRAEVDELIEKVDDGADDAPPSPWMTIAEYARHANVSADTVRRSWIAKGMPHTRNPIRINRDEADAWRKTR